MNRKRAARRLVFALPLLLCACIATPRLPQPTPAPRFDPFVFFNGRSHGTATLHKIFSKPVPIRVESRGHVEDDTLVLDQVVTEGTKPARTRQWRIRETGPGRYDGTLSDAASPVRMDVSGNRLHIAFAMKGGFPTDQWLYLSPDGRSARNMLVVRKFGFGLARLEERIVRD